MDKEDSPAESNDSDSEEAAVDRERALAEKEKVKRRLRTKPVMCEAAYERRMLLLSGERALQRRQVRRGHRVLLQRDGRRSSQPGAPHKPRHLLLQTQEVSGTGGAGEGTWNETDHRTQAVLPRYAVAESDCNLAIVLDPGYAKAYARRGAARVALKKYEPALEGETVGTVRASETQSAA